MPELELTLADARYKYRPCETIRGQFAWRTVDRPIKTLELRLFWYTQGKGTQDLGLVQSRRFGALPPSGQQSFEFRLPDGPYSFSGKLITLSWALELLAQPGKDACRLDLVVSPTQSEIFLPTLG